MTFKVSVMSLYGIMRRGGWLGGAGMALLTAAAWAAEPVSSGEAFRAAHSRLRSMAHGYHTAAEWGKALNGLEDLADRARDEGDGATVVNAVVLKAWALGEVLERHEEAIAVLRGLHGEPGWTTDQMRRLYVAEASIRARAGDESALRRLIEEFRQSPWYDGRKIEYSGGRGTQEPLVVRRPGITADDSLTISLLNRRRAQARLAPGNPCPDFSVVDREGRVHSLASYAGRVLLIDFWVARWPAWQQDLPNQARLYHAYHAQGLDILGVGLDADPATARKFLQRHGATWPQAVEGRELAAEFGLFGEADNILVNRGGMIVARNVRGSDLAGAIRRALEKP